MNFEGEEMLIYDLFKEGRRIHERRRSIIRQNFELELNSFKIHYCRISDQTGHVTSLNLQNRKENSSHSEN